VNYDDDKLPLSLIQPIEGGSKIMTTKILGEASDIQWQGTRDLTATSAPAGLTTGLIIGRFKRGRTDKPMLIDDDTIRARLCYDPLNPDYQAVQDCLDTGVPNVWVLRVSDPIVPGQ
jgi:hypothetical protein